MKKGDIGSTIIMWLAILSVAIIVSSWFVTTIRPLRGESKIIDFDMNQVITKVENACTSFEFQTKYNPRMNFGEIEFNQTQLCITTQDIKDCRELPCEVTEYTSFNLATISNIIIIKNQEGIKIEKEDFVQ